MLKIIFIISWFSEPPLTQGLFDIRQIEIPGNKGECLGDEEQGLFDIRQGGISGNKGECSGDGEICCANVKIEYKCVEADQCLEWVFHAKLLTIIIVIYNYKL